MLAVYVVLYNGTTLWHTIGRIEIVMTCYGGKSKFADESECGEGNVVNCEVFHSLHWHRSALLCNGNTNTFAKCMA